MPLPLEEPADRLLAVMPRDRCPLDLEDPPVVPRSEVEGLPLEVQAQLLPRLEALARAALGDLVRLQMLQQNQDLAVNQLVRMDLHHLEDPLPHRHLEANQVSVAPLRSPELIQPPAN